MINDKKKKQVDADKAEASIDQAFEMGYMQGYKDAKTEAMVEQAMMQQEEMAGAAAGINPGAMPRPQAGAPQMGPSMNSVPGDMQMPEAGQLTEATDNLINQLHGSDQDMPEEVKKSIKEITDLNAVFKQNIEMKKIEMRTQELKKSMTSLTGAKKKVVYQQEETVKNLMQKWEDESKEAVKNLTVIASQHTPPVEE